VPLISALYAATATPPAGGLVQFLGFDPSALGLGGFVSLIIVSIIRGWLVPKATYSSVLKAKDDEIERLKLTVVTLQASGDVLDETVRDIVQAQASTQHALEQIHTSLMRLTAQTVPANYPVSSPTTAELAGDPT
jgi:uncharacterized ion transporter superfamily protein YfcC